MLISPSILSADFGNLDREIEMLNCSAASMIHIDIMDGVFVPNISLGFPVLRAITKVAKKPLDVHMMVTKPDDYINKVRDCGATYMNVHQEACVHLDRTIHAIRDAGMRPAVTLNPSTPVELLRDIISEVDMVLLMSVNPGFGGQKFIPNTVGKVRRLRKMVEDAHAAVNIEIDGGVNLETGALLAEAGADVLVAGSAIFRSEDPISYISQLSQL